LSLGGSHRGGSFRLCDDGCPRSVLARSTWVWNRWAGRRYAVATADGVDYGRDPRAHARTRIFALHRNYAIWRTVADSCWALTCSISCSVAPSCAATTSAALLYSCALVDSPSDSALSASSSARRVCVCRSSCDLSKRLSLSSS